MHRYVYSMNYIKQLTIFNITLIIMCIHTCDQMLMYYGFSHLCQVVYLYPCFERYHTPKKSLPSAFRLPRSSAVCKVKILTMIIHECLRRKVFLKPTKLGRESHCMPGQTYVGKVKVQLHTNCQLTMKCQWSS